MKKIITVALFIITYQLAYSQQPDINSSTNCNTSNCTYTPDIVGTITQISGPIILCNGDPTILTVQTNLPPGTSVSYDIILSNNGTPMQYPGYPIVDDEDHIITAINGGLYSVVVSTLGFDNDTLVFLLDEPQSIFNVLNKNDVSCFGANDGQITLNTAFGTAGSNGGYSYSLNGGVFTPYTSPETIFSLSPITHNLQIQDANNCIYSGPNTSITINQPTALLTTLTGSTDATCFGAIDGTASVTINGGGTANYDYVWTNSSGVQVESTLNTSALSNTLTTGQGTYICTITDANTCLVQSISVTINEPSVLIVTPTGLTDVNCNGGSDGSATVTISGGTANYDYVWTNNSGGAQVGSTINSNILSNTLTTVQGIYICTVTDANNCSEQSTLVTINEPTALIVTPTGSTDATCFGSNDGTATVSVSGGTANYDYVWTNTANGAQVASTQNSIFLINTLTAQAGTYFCTITDANNCSQQSTLFTINEPTVLTVTPTATTLATCFGSIDGTATVSVSGGTANYDYVWTNSIGVQVTSTLNTSALTNTLTAGQGTYICTVTDANNCSQPSISVTINEPTQLITSSSLSTPVTCFGFTDGTATATASGGTANYDYVWTNSSGVQVESTLGSPLLTNTLTAEAGTYTCTLTDANNCSVFSTVIITQSLNLLTVTLGAPTDATCFGLADGTATVIVSGGTANYDYVWTNTAVSGPVASTLNSSLLTNTITSSAAGSYICTITDANNCTVNSDNITIIEPSVLTVGITTVSNVSCFGGNNGEATAIADGGTELSTDPFYNYVWSNGDLSETANGLSAGLHTVTVTDANGCFVTDAVTITEPSVIVVTGVETDIDCNGNNTGAIDLTVSGGTGNFNFLWSNSDISEDVTSLLAGTYNVIVQDNGTCDVTLSFTIQEPAVLEYNLDITDITCFGTQTGAIDLNLFGGTAPYNAFWSLPSGTQNSEDLINLFAGTYTCQIFDFNECVLEVTGTISEPTAITLTTSPYTIPVTCFGESDGGVGVVADGGTPYTNGNQYTYNWSNTYFTQNVSDLTAGFYSLAVFDSLGCSMLTQVTVSEPTQITTSLSVVDVSCNSGEDGQITANSTNGSQGGPYSYFWSNIGVDDAINNGLSAGTYDLIITDIGSNGNGGFNNCSETFLGIIVSEPSPITNTWAITQITTAGADDGIITANVTGGSGSYDYSWTSTNGFVGTGVTNNGLSAGIYTIIVTDGICPPVTLIYALNEPSCNVIITPTYIEPDCPGDLGSLIWSISGGVAPYTQNLIDLNGNVLYDNLISTPSVPLLLPAGTYNLLVIDDSDSACSDIWNEEVIVPDSILLSFTTTDVSCFGGDDGTATPIISGGTPGYNPVDWGGVNPSNLIAGNYYATVTDANFCSSEVITYTISQPTELFIDSVLTTLVSCPGTDDGTATVFGSGGSPGPLGYAYLWSTGEITQTISNLAVGTYWVIISDTAGCLKELLNIQITQAPLLTASIQDSVISCYGGADGILTAIVTGGTPTYSYLWYDLSFPSPLLIGAGPSLSSLSPGAYGLLVNDINGCASSFSVTTLINPPAINLMLFPIDLTLNGADDGIISSSVSGGTNPYTYAWTGPNGFSNTLSATITSLEPGTYTLMVTDAAGCTQIQQAVINEDSCNVTITPTIIQPNCSGDLGTISWTNAGGGLSYTNTITDVNILMPLYTSSLSSDISPLLADGDYSLLIEDQYGCSDLVNFFIEAPAPLTPDITITHVSCNGGNDGTVSITGIGGTAPYYVDYGLIDTLALYAGLETYILTDFNDCENLFTLPYEITEPDPITPITFELSPVICNGDTNGSATVTVTGGTGPYEYIWSPSGDTTATIISFAGQHFVTVIDSNGCSSLPTSVTITEPDLFIVTIIPTDVTCFGGNDGTAIASTSGGTNPVTYLWNNGYTIPNLVSILDTGEYECIAIDFNGCTDTATTIVNQPTEISPNLTLTHVSCNGGNNGEAKVIPTGGGGINTYQYLWYDGTTNANVNSLYPGNYWVTITDAVTLCTFSEYFEITEPDNLASVTSVISIPSCYGEDDASVIVEVSGGTVPYDYIWTNSAGTTVSTTNDSVAFNLVAGTYYVQVTDANNCIKLDTITFTEPLPILANISADSTQCDGTGSAFATPTGGTAPYTYLWSGGTGANTDSTYLGLNSAITYFVTITDTNNCSLTSAAINIPSSVIITNSYNLSNYNGFNISCYGESDGSFTSITSGGSAPYEYEWNTGALTQDLTNLLAGTYTVEITDTNGCMGTSSVTIDQPDQILSGLIVTNVTCIGENDGSASVNPGPDHDILWFDGTSNNLNVGPMSPANYWVTITNTTTFCTITDTFAITEPDTLASITSVISIPSCNGGEDASVIVSVRGGTIPYDYIWTNSAGNTVSTSNDSVAFNLSAGTYYVQVTDANNCIQTDSITITEPLPILANISADSTQCDGTGSAFANPTGGTAPYTYLWSGGTGANTDSAYLGLNSATTYFVTITDANNCFLSSSAINIPSSVIITNSYNLSNYNGFNISCYDESDGSLTSITSGGSAPYEYVWNTGALTQDLTNLSAGTYNVDITDTNGCMATSSVTIDQPDQILSGLIVTNVTCNGENDGSASVNPGPDHDILWFDGTSDNLNVGPMSPAVYTVLITNTITSCTITDTLEITEPDNLVSVTSVISIPSCNGEDDASVIVEVSGGTVPYDYIWTNSAGATVSTTNGSVAFNLVAGTYYVQVTDTNNCIQTDSITITEPLPILANISADSTQCDGTGSAFATPTGGTAPYTYSWTGGTGANTNSTYLGLNSAITYFVTITDSNNCSLIGVAVNIPSSVIITNSYNLSNYNGFNISCYDESDGSLTSITSGGSAPYEYVWNNGALTQDLTNLSAGTYTVDITDTNGCMATSSVTIDQPDQILSGLIVTNVTCNGDNDASASVNPGPDHDILWFDGTSDNLNAGPMSPVPGYWVTITNIITSCTITDTLEITEPDNLASVTSVISIPSCNGEDDASVIVEVSGGTIPYNYMWTNSAGTTVSTTNDSVAFNLVAGTYYVQVTDANNCIKLDSITITEPLPILANISADSTQCDGTGSAFATPTGGTAPYIYSWSGGTGANTDSTYLGLNSAITYFVTITDSNNCSLTGVAVNIPSSVIITNSYNLSNYNGFNISCYGESDGSATSLLTSGGSAPYEYVWNNGSTIASIQNLLAGTYTVEITDTNGCMGTSSVIIDQPDQILSGLIATNVTCNGENDGSALVNPGSGHTFVWYDGTSDNLNVGPMSPGSYWVTTTNTLTSCEIIEYFDITEPDNLESPINLISSPSCNGEDDASVVAEVSGGTIPYNYIWTNSDGATVSTTNDSVAFNLGAGTYYVQVTDANNCIQTDSITITEVTIIMTNITFVNPSCSGGSDGIAITTPTGGTSPYTYLWSGGTGANTDSTYLGLNSSSNYNVTITDANNCTHTEDVNLPATGGITINYTLSNYNGFNVSCYDSANAIVTINALGGTPPYLYSEDGINYTNDPIFSNISAGLLTIYVKEFAGCVASTSIMITGPTSIIPNITIENILTCDGLNDGALLSEPIGGNPGSGGYAYQWSNSVTVDSISELNSGSYSVIVTDINLCTGYDTILLIPAYILSADAEELNPVSCYGFSDGSATINVSGATPPFNYSWNTGATTQTILAGLSFGQYWCTITDVSGCTITDTVDITQSPNSLTITSTEITDVSCNGGNDGEINITASGGTGGTYTTLWTPGGQTATTATALTSGTYSVAVTDNANCTVYDTLIVEEPTAMIMSSIISTDITCFGENDGIISTVVTGGTPGYTYLWSNNQIGDTITNLIQGTYYINVIDSNGCILIDSAIINESDPLISIISETNPLCHNDSNGIIDVICKGGIPPYLATYMSIPYTIADSNIVANITGLSAGTNTLYLTDDNGCNINTDITLTNPLELEVIKLAQIDPVCYNYATGVAEVTINGGISPYTYSWSDLQSTAKAIDLMSGNYNCTVTDINGCTDSTSFLLVNPFEIEILASVQDILCFGTSEGSISVNVENAIGNYEIFWQEDANDSIFIDNLLAGLYHVTIIDDNSCTKTDSILVNQTAEMVIDYTIYPTSCKDIEDGSIEINNIYGGTPPFNVYKNGELHTEGTYNSTNIENLASSDNGLPYIIKVIDNNNCEEDSNFMINYIGGYNCIDEPIIISPNYDGTNDVWQPVVDLDVDMEVSILNRWGELEYNYSGNSLLFIWDGVPENGGELPSADYYYIIKFKNNSYPTRTGALTLIR